MIHQPGAGSGRSSPLGGGNYDRVAPRTAQTAALIQVGHDCRRRGQGTRRLAQSRSTLHRGELLAAARSKKEGESQKRAATVPSIEERNATDQPPARGQTSEREVYAHGCSSSPACSFTPMSLASDMHSCRPFLNSSISSCVGAREGGQRWQPCSARMVVSTIQSRLACSGMRGAADRGRLTCTCPACLGGPAQSCPRTHPCDRHAFCLTRVAIHVAEACAHQKQQPVVGAGTASLQHKWVQLVGGVQGPCLCLPTCSALP